MSDPANSVSCVANALREFDPHGVKNEIAIVTRADFPYSLIYSHCVEVCSESPPPQENFWGHVVESKCFRKKPDAVNAAFHFNKHGFMW
jgi:hypothetical protein